MKLLRGQKLYSRYKSNRVFLDLSSNQRWDNFYEKKSQHAGFDIIYKYNINKLMGREGEVRVLMNTLNSSFHIFYQQILPFVVVTEERAVSHSRVSGLASVWVDQESPYLSNGG